MILEAPAHSTMSSSGFRGPAFDPIFKSRFEKPLDLEQWDNKSWVMKGKVHLCSKPQFFIGMSTVYAIDGAVFRALALTSQK